MKKIAKFIYKLGDWFFITPFGLAIVASLVSLFFPNTTTWFYLMVVWGVFMVIGFVNLSIYLWASNNYYGNY